MYEQDDLTEYLDRKIDCDGNDLEYELANHYWHIVFRNQLYRQYITHPRTDETGT